MLGELRQQKLVDLLMTKKSVRISELREMFDVSEETIRRDLKKLESDGVLKRTHGGAILAEEVHVVPPFSQRSQQQLREKMALADKAAALVGERATVMLDSGSTTLEIARRLAGRHVTVITNDLTIAMELSGSLHVQLIVLGESAEGNLHAGRPRVRGDHSAVPRRLRVSRDGRYQREAGPHHIVQRGGHRQTGDDGRGARGVLRG
ncbi:hypothetical protein GCM10025857_30030 [Alicyclobacillus contaminans]|nr:hypothetical protein GCM10025857_30030 [Alicyclobacillus contaminans]